MNPAQLQQYRDLLARGKFDPDKQSREYVYQRAWNDAIVFAEDKMKQVLNNEAAA